MVVEKVVTDDGAHLAAVSTGVPSAAPVLLCHGGPGMWDYLAPVAHLLPDHRVYRFDQRGCGGSTGPGDYSVARAIADIEVLRRHWGYDRWTVFGHSWGATLALAYAWTYPDRVNALIYCSGTGPGAGWKADYQVAEAARLTPQQLRRRAYLKSIDRSPAQTIEYHTLCWCTDYADARAGMTWARQDATDAPHQVNLVANAALQQEAATWTLEQVQAWCARVTAHAMVIHGSQDPRPMWSVQRVADALPLGHLAVMEGVGHQPWREDSSGFAALLAGFIDRFAAADGA